MEEWVLFVVINPVSGGAAPFTVDSSLRFDSDDKCQIAEDEINALNGVNGLTVVARSVRTR